MMQRGEEGGMGECPLQANDSVDSDRYQQATIEIERSRGVDHMNKGDSRTVAASLGSCR
jgi:hypothetical protein